MRLNKIFKSLTLVVAALGSVVMLSSSTAVSGAKDNPNVTLINMVIQEMCSELPLDLGEGLSMSALYVGNSNLVMEIVCPDDMIDLLRERVGLLKDELLGEISSDEMSKLMLGMCYEAGYGFVIVYSNKAEDNQVRITFTNAELRNYAQ